MTYFSERIAHLGEITYPLPATSRHNISLVREISDSAPDGHFEGEASVSGRIAAVRGHGRMIFADVADGTGQIQLMIPAAAESAHAAATRLQRGDVISVSGAHGRSRRGEISITVDELTLLSPALRPLPDAHVGISDTETLRRDRTLDLLVHSDTRERLVMRSRIIEALRRCLIDEQYIEVETPILHAQPTGAASEAFETHARHIGETRYLRAAPEFYLERLVTAGIERVFELSRNFRNESADRTHSPEFTALEWYGAFESTDDQMQRCRRMLAAAGHAAGSDMFASISERSFADVWTEQYACDPADEASVRAALGVGEGETHAQLLDMGWDRIEDQLTDAVFITRWPSLMSPLARPCDDNPFWCDRWDLYAGSMELGACYQELNDPAWQRILMEETGAVDEEFLDDMLLGMPPMSGAGLGVDRIVMLLTGAEHIRDTLSFPDYRR